MRSTLAVFGTCALALLGSCGDDEGGSGRAKDEFVEQADAACAQMNERVVDLSREFEDEAQAVDERLEAGEADAVDDFFDLVARQTRALLEVQRAAMADIRALSPPEGDAETLEDLLEATDAAFDIAESRAASAAAGDEDARGELLSGDATFDELNQRFIAYGLVECGRDPFERTVA